jgi:ABC-type lipoprotein release transport system permease subunit
MEHPIAEIEVTIKGLNTSSNFGYVSADVLKEMRKASLFTYGLYFEGIENISTVNRMAENMNYIQQLIIVEGIYTMTRAVEVIVPIFDIVNYVLCVTVISILVTFAVKMIRDKMKEIGILKSLGAKNRSLVSIFGLQIGLIALLSSLMSLVGYALFIDLANKLLVESLQTLATGRVVLDLDFIYFIPWIALVDILMIFMLSALALVVPMAAISNIKPVKIIKTKE